VLTNMPNNPQENKTILTSDHDILVATYTLQQVLVGRLEDYIKGNNERLGRTEAELQSIAREQIRVNGELTNLKGVVSNVNEQMDDRLDKLENKNTWMNVGAYLGVIVAGVIAWFKG
jgi:hypothetical protein